MRRCTFKSLTRLVICGSAAAALAGCAQVAATGRAGGRAVNTMAGNVSDRLTPADTRLWRPGVTTLAQVSDMLGPPADDNFLPDGNRLIRWRGNVGVRTSQRLAYGFVFTRQGLLVRRANNGEMHAPGL